VNYVSYESVSVPDPTCTRGIRSANGLGCCTASCGAGNCGNSTVAIDPVGFCTTAATRPCSQFGPPCRL
jgi:hypothetical protein